MSKFNTKTHRAQATAPIQTTGQKTVTFEGGHAFKRDAKSDLFLLAVTNRVGEDSFYESGADRDARFRNLVHTVVQDDPEWVARMLAFIRGPQVNLRSAALVGAAEYVKAGGPNGRQVVASVLQRADEPGEMLAYWTSQYGRKIPAAVKRGVADATVRLYNEYAALKYDGRDNSFRLGDVIELVHPKPKDERQAAVFAYLLDRRHHADQIRADLDRLSTISEARAIDRMERDDFRRLLLADPARLEKAGFTWERVSGKTEMDAEAWGAIIPTMGYMALLRNLRNFDEKSVPSSIKDEVAARLMDPEEVAKSRQMPFRFWSAYKATQGSFDWAKALERALDLSTKNIPDLSDTLVLIDTSGSMTGVGYGYSGSRGRRTGEVAPNRPIDIAALVALSLVKKTSNAEVVIFGDTSRVLTDIRANTPVLRGMEAIARTSGSVGHGTYGWTAFNRHFRAGKHKRAFIFTDGQMHDSSGVALGKSGAPVYIFNVAGYGPAPMETGRSGAYEIGGFTDATFQMVPLLEAGRSADWPF